MNYALRIAFNDNPVQLVRCGRNFENLVDCAETLVEAELIKQGVIDVVRRNKAVDEIRQSLIVDGYYNGVMDYGFEAWILTSTGWETVYEGAT